METFGFAIRKEGVMGTEGEEESTRSELLEVRMVKSFSANYNTISLQVIKQAEEEASILQANNSSSRTTWPPQNTPLLPPKPLPQYHISNYLTLSR